MSDLGEPYGFVSPEEMFHVDTFACGLAIPVIDGESVPPRHGCR